MRFCRLLVIAVAFVLAPCLRAQTTPQEKTWLSYKPAVVELQGKLNFVTKYGPPNYGENPKTDRKVKVLILVLSKAVNVRGDPNSDLNSESVEGVKQVQLAIKPGIAYKQFVGKHVKAKGTLFHSITGHHYTRVLMDMLEIKEEKDKKDK